MTYLIDTNILVYYWMDTLPPSALNFVQSVLASDFKVSLITQIEFLGFYIFKQDPAEGQRAHRFLAQAHVYSIESEIVDKTIDILQNYKIKLPDAVIAATALIYDLTLLTRDLRGFPSIVGLKYLNPFEQT